MSDERRTRDEERLEAALVGLGRRLPYPPTPAIAQSVQSRLHIDSGSLRRRPSGGIPVRSLGLGMVAAVVLLAGVMIASPSARASVATWLDIPGVRISVGSPSPAHSEPTGGLGLGRRVTLEAARAQVSFPILVPAVPGFRRPDEVYVDTFPPGGRVSLLYRARPNLPQSTRTGVGLLLTEFRATAGQVYFGKFVGWKSMPQGIRVGSGHGYWIKGKHLTYLYRSIGSRRVWSSVRLAGPTLLWERDGLIFRLESGLSESAAARLAASMR